MSAHPEVDRFHRPAVAWYLVNDGGLATLFTLSLRPQAHAALARRLPLPPVRVVRRVSLALVVIHLAEAAVAARLVRRRGLHRSGRRWVLHTLVVGAPALVDLHRSTRP